MATQSFNRQTQDVGNIVFLEHVNLTAPDQGTATTFYVEGLGYTRDPYMMVSTDNMWINAGQQQFHLPKGPPQKLRGHVGLVVPDLNELEKRLRRVKKKLVDTQFGFQAKKTHVAITGPWGNKFQAYKNGNGYPGPCGIPYVEMPVPVGAAKGIAAFYQQCFGAPAEVKTSRAGRSTVRICVGPKQQLIFRETASELPPYDGHHIAIYVADFSGPHAFLKKQKMISREDNQYQFRFQEIVPPGKKKSAFTIEHEVRSLHHPLYRVPLVNRSGNERLP